MKIQFVRWRVTIRIIRLTCIFHLIETLSKVWHRKKNCRIRKKTLRHWRSGVMFMNEKPVGLLVKMIEKTDEDDARLSFPCASLNNEIVSAVSQNWFSPLFFYAYVVLRNLFPSSRYECFSHSYQAGTKRKKLKVRLVVSSYRIAYAGAVAVAFTAFFDFLHGLETGTTVNRETGTSSWTSNTDDSNDDRHSYKSRYSMCASWGRERSINWFQFL